MMFQVRSLFGMNADNIVKGVPSKKTEMLVEGVIRETVTMSSETVFKILKSGGDFSCDSAR